MSFFDISKKICLFNFRHVLFPPKTEPICIISGGSGHILYFALEFFSAGQRNFASEWTYYKLHTFFATPEPMYVKEGLKANFMNSHEG